MEINYKDLAEVKAEIAIIKEKQKIINNRVDELVVYNSQISTDLKNYNKKVITYKSNFIKVILFSSLLLVSSLITTFIVIVNLG
jgi:hypothetical protein